MSNSPILPVDEYLDDIRATLESGKDIVVSAEPGAGKTTRIPKALLALKHLKKIYVLEPRRLAAKLAAQRVSAEIGEECGHTVGYLVRFERMISDKTRLVFLTEALLIKLLLDGTENFDRCVVVLDEFHERNLNTDLSLAMVRYLQLNMQVDVRLIAMSATLDVERLGAYISGAKTYKIGGRSFPLNIEYHPSDSARSDLSRDVLSAIKAMIAKVDYDGHILVFLPGQREIMRVRDQIANAAELKSYDVLPLYADLSPQEQKRVFSDIGRRKIVLSTNVAETSVTIPGVSGVIDCGLAKISAFSPWSGMATLDLKRVSQASSIQRAGRAGRERSGIVFRLYSQHDFAAREAFTPPEIRRADLNQAMLQTSAFIEKYSSDSLELPWFENPDPHKWDHARQLLEALGAMDSDGAITEKGRFYLDFPVHARLAAVIAKGCDIGIDVDAVIAAAVIHEGFVFREDDSAATHSTCDIALQVEVVKASLAKEELPPSLARMVLPSRMELIKRTVAAFEKTLRKRFDFRDPVSPRLSEALFVGFYDRVGKRIKTAKENAAQTSYSFCLGGGGTLAKQSSLDAPEYILAIDARERTQGSAANAVTVWYATALSPEFIVAQKSKLLGRKEESRFNERSGKHERFEQMTYGQLLLSEKKVESVFDASNLLHEFREKFPWPFDSRGDLDDYHARVATLRTVNLGADLPVFEGELFELLLDYIVEGKSSLGQITERSLYAYIQDQLSYEGLTELNRLAPKQLRLENKKAFNITYSPDKSPSITGFIQDFYGVASDVHIADGKIPVTVTLVGPNKRPVQTTQSLASFWINSFPELKREFCRRYPRHIWAEHPQTAEPILHKPRKIRS